MFSLATNPLVHDAEHVSESPGVSVVMPPVVEHVTDPSVTVGFKHLTAKIISKDKLILENHILSYIMFHPKHFKRLGSHKIWKRNYKKEIMIYQIYFLVYHVCSLAFNLISYTILIFQEFYLP